MDARASSAIFFAFFILLSSSATAFNITRLLDRFPEFSTFNDLLTKTHLDSQINSRQTITVLAVDNSAIGAVSGKPEDVQKRILSNHVILDYYDSEKLGSLSKKSSLLTTLFQTTGIAENQQGFLNVTHKGSDEVVFGSAVRGSLLNSKLVKSVSAQPYNISVLQVSSVIIAAGIESPSPQHAPASDAPAESPKNSPPKKKHPGAEEPSSDSAEAPEAPSPYAESPKADAPVADAPGPAHDKEKAADEAHPPSSSAIRVGLGVGLAIVMGLVSALMA